MVQKAVHMLSCCSQLKAGIRKKALNWLIHSHGTASSSKLISQHKTQMGESWLTTCAQIWKTLNCCPFSLIDFWCFLSDCCSQVTQDKQRQCWRRKSKRQKTLPRWSQRSELLRQHNESTMDKLNALASLKCALMLMMKLLLLLFLVMNCNTELLWWCSCGQKQEPSANQCDGVK